MYFDWMVRLSAVACILLTGPVSAAPATHGNGREIPPSQATNITTNRAVTPQARRVIAFNEQGVFFSTDFDGGRLASVRATAPGRFEVVVEAENYPVNDSPWYAFKIWAASNSLAEVELKYKGSPHRYNPKVSRDRVHWEPVSDGIAANGKTKDAFRFQLEIGPEPKYVASQELFTSSDYERWIQEVSLAPFVRSRVLGNSTLGRPIQALEITEANAPADCVVIIGRQHPPEVTGAIALTEFVQTLCGKSELAAAFRQRFTVTVVPVMNPDGVDSGHWRHNARGTDLNRDWGQFNQVETRLVRDVMAQTISRDGGKVCFVLDFHSTQADVFYVSHPTMPGRPNDISWKWLKSLRKAMSGYDLKAEHSLQSPEGPTLAFTPWASKFAGIPAVTYEAGDKTDRRLIRQVARKSAESMMSTLLGEAQSGKVSANAQQTTDLRIALYKGAGTGGKGPSNIIRYFDATTNVVVSEIGPSEIRAGLLRQFDAVIFAGGSASKQAETIGEKGKQEVRSFVEGGGGYVGICAGAYLASSGFSWGLRLLDARTVSPKWERGAGDVRMELTSLGQNCLADMPGELTVHYENGPILRPDEAPDLNDYEVLAFYRTELAENGSPKGVMKDSPAILRGTLGRGRVICFGPHPEQTPGLEHFIEAGVLWAASHNEVRTNQ